MQKFVPIGAEDPMSTLCRMVVETKYEDLPDNVVNCTKRYILDTLAATIGGSAMEGIPAVVDLVKHKGGKPESFIPFYGGKVPASEAGFAMGPMARAMDFGNFNEEVGHTSEYILPAMLAVSGLKDKVTGKEFITAFVVGHEVLMRVGLAFRGISSKGRLTGRGHGHSIFGGVAAVAKLLGLTLEELENAEGIARGMTQPHDLAMYVPATLMIRIHHAFICQDAINACLLAQKGITGPRQEVLVGPRGFLGLANWETDAGALTSELGQVWETLNIITKPYSCWIGAHNSINGLLEQMEKYHFKAEDIAGINIEVCSTNIVGVIKEVKWNPQTVQDCQFSLPYLVATAAYTKDIFLDSYTPQAMARKDVRDLMSRLSVSEDQSLAAHEVRVHTTLKDGRKFSGGYVHLKGSPQNPLTEQEIINKFKRCVPYSAYKLNDEVVDSLIKAILSLEKVDDIVNTLLVPLTPK